MLLIFFYLKMSLFYLLLKGYFYWIKNSRFTGVFVFSNFKDVFRLYSSLQMFWWKLMIIKLLLPNIKCVIYLWLLSRFSVFCFHQFDYDVSSHGFFFLIYSFFDSLSFLKSHFCPSSNFGNLRSFVLQICFMLFFLSPLSETTILS